MQENIRTNRRLFCQKLYLLGILILVLATTGCTYTQKEDIQAEISLTIKEVITDETTSTSTATHVTKVIYEENGVEKTIEAQKGVLTLVVDGVQEDISVGDTFSAVENFSFTDTMVVKSGEGAPPWQPDSKKAVYQFRQALYIDAQGVNVDASVVDAITGEYSDTSASGVEIYSNGAFFNGIYISDAAYTLKNPSFHMVGDGGDDFSGWGAALMADGNASVTVDGALIDTTGVIRTGVWAGGNSSIEVSDSVITAHETLDTQEEYDALVVSMMKRTPFALGMEGVVRATNVLNAATAVYDNSIIVSSGWGALSTDSGIAYEENENKYALTIKDCLAGIGSVEVAKSDQTYTATKEINGVTYGFTMQGSGYVSYSDAGVWNQYDNVEFYSPDYIQIMASGKSSAFYTNSKLYSDRIAFMTQQNAGGLLEVKDSLVYATDTLLQIKSGAANNGYTDFVIDNTSVELGGDNPWSGSLVQLVESDDAGNPGITSYQINDVGEDAMRTSSLGEIESSHVTFKNGIYTGNIWNNIYNYTQALDVTIDNAVLDGQISAAVGYHADSDGNRLENGTVLKACLYPNYLDPVNGTSGEYLTIGAYVNIANEVVNNPVHLTITNGGKWIVEGESNYLGTLRLYAIEDIEAGNPVTIYVQNMYVGDEAYDDGTYTHGNITYVVESAKEIDINTDTLATTQDYSGLHAVTFKAVDADGNPMSKAVALSYKAFTTIDFSVRAKDGYKITEVYADSDGILIDHGDGTYTISDLVQTKNTITVVAEENLEEQVDGIPAP